MFGKRPEKDLLGERNEVFRIGLEQPALVRTVRFGE
jgi:hypothetical protein